MFAIHTKIVLKKLTRPCFFQLARYVFGENKMPHEVTKTTMLLLRYLLTVTKSGRRFCVI